MSQGECAGDHDDARPLGACQCVVRRVGMCARISKAPIAMSRLRRGSARDRRRGNLNS